MACARGPNKELVVNLQTTQKQFEALVEILEQNPDFAKGYVRMPQGREGAKNMWEHVTSTLNALGPPLKDSNGWKTVWSSFKQHVQRKLSKDIEISKTGGGHYRQTTFTATEEAVIRLCNFKEKFSGIQNTKKFGPPAENKQYVVEEHNQNETVVDNSEVQINECFTNDDEQPKSFNKKRATKTIKNNLIEKQINVQADFHKEVVEKLDCISINVEHFTKEMVELQKQNIAIKKEKLEIEKEKLEIEKEKLEIEKEKLEIEKEKFNLILN